MITNDQRNIKVHFAGAESLMRANLMEAAGIKYLLFTIFPFLADKYGIKHGYQQAKNYQATINKIQECTRHSIQDSGLFSLMFGKHSGNRDLKFMETWYNDLVQMTIEGNFKGSVVEVDCQNLFGVEQAWKFREQMRKDLPNNRIVNVFHPIDGQKGLDRMIEFSDYIAISVPELKGMGKKNHLQSLTHYIKNKKPMIDIHLLGCTDNGVMKDLSFCTSSDSTSWTSLNKFGQFRFNDGSKTIAKHKSAIKHEKLNDNYRGVVAPILAQLGMKVTESSINYFSCEMLAFESLLKQYAFYGGEQN